VKLLVAARSARDRLNGAMARLLGARVGLGCHGMSLALPVVSQRLSSNRLTTEPELQ
jgi:hypothetical protein